MKWPRLFIPLIPCTVLLAGTAYPLEPATVVETYTAASSAQNARLRGASMEVEIEASLPKLKKHGRLQALRRISLLGRISYEIIHFEGDRSIKSDVIARYIAADAQPNDGTSLAVTPANYKFKYRGMAEQDGRTVQVFKLTPRKKRVGLFKGDLWLDAETCLPVRESGRLVKLPSIFLRRIEFVREYEIRDGMAFPHSVESVVDTRLVGKAELKVRFQNYSLAENPAVSMASGSGQ